MFGAVYGGEGVSIGALLGVAEEFSPRVEVCGPREVTLDLSGLERLFGDARTIGQELRRTAADRGLRVRVAIAGTRTAARLHVHHAADRTGPPRPVIVIEPGTEAASLAPLPIALLSVLADAEPAPSHRRTVAPPHPLAVAPPPIGPFDTLRRWGLRTLGDLAALPADAVAARLGQDGVQWQRLARGDDPRPLLPSVPEERFEEALDLEWPIEGLEPLSFVLGRLLEPLSAQLERRGRGAAVLHVRLNLIKTPGVTPVVHERSLQLPAPIRDARTLRTLAVLDLESHPPPAAIDRVVVAIDPTPGRVLQFSLLARPLPSPEQLSTLMARLHALMGEDRCGSPADVDAWQPGAFAITPFAPVDANATHSHAHKPQRHRATAKNFSRSAPHAPQGVDQRDRNLNSLCASVSLWPVEGVASGSSRKEPSVALRRFRFPVPARVQVDDGKPSRVVTDRRGLSGGRVDMCAGPWRTSGGWWAIEAKAWDRDEWDVTLGDGATYRLFRERAAGAWFVEGIVD